MKILALHDSEEIASLLMDITLVTEVDVFSVPTLKKFEEYLSKYPINVVILLDKFFTEGIEVVLRNKKAPKAVSILTTEEENIAKFLRLGITDANIETIPFNPLTYFVKIRGLINNLNLIKQAIENGKIDFDFYRFGLFNILNIFAATDENLFLAIKDAEEDETLYSLRIRNGQVVSASIELPKIVEINLDDSVPKRVVAEPVVHNDAEIFRDTAEFYKALLEVEPESAAAETPPQVERVEISLKRKDLIRVNPLRGRNIYTFPFGGMQLYSQPDEQLRKVENALFAVALIDDYILSALKVLKLKGGAFKILTCPMIRTFLKLQGFEDKLFIEPKGVEIFEFPNLGNRLECAFYLPREGVLLSGNLFGSYVSKNIPFFDRIFLSHLRVYHRANICCGEKLQRALEALEPLKGKLSYAVPTYGYAIDKTQIGKVFDVLSQLDIPQEPITIEREWENLKRILPLEVKNLDEFIESLRKQDEAVLYNLIDEMDVLSVVPYEF